MAIVLLLLSTVAAKDFGVEREREGGLHNLERETLGICGEHPSSSLRISGRSTWQEKNTANALTKSSDLHVFGFGDIMLAMTMITPSLT